MAPLSSALATSALSALGFAGVQQGAATDVTFDDFLNKHGLQYRGADKDQRKETYEAVLKKIEEHNANDKNTWKMGLNEFAVLTDKEFAELLGYMKRTNGHTRDINPKAPANVTRVADSVDWRKHTPNVVTAVKSQGSCGSCWAFAATAVIESRVALDTTYLFSLSPQQITSCAPNPEECGGSGGCSGATGPIAFDYVMKAGMTQEWNYPYTSGITSKNGDCFDLEGRKTPSAGITDFVHLTLNDADDLMAGVNVGPVVVSVAASNWKYYDHGIFDGCDKVHPIINHAVVLMGYGQEEGVAYWLIRNSWGPRWGEHGYIRLRRYPGNEPCGDDNEPLSGNACKANPPDSIKVCGMCGVLSDSSYPTGGYLGTPQDPEDPAVGSVQEKVEVSGSARRGIAAQLASASGIPASAALGCVSLLAFGMAVPALRRHLAARRTYAEVEVALAGGDANDA